MLNFHQHRIWSRENFNSSETASDFVQITYWIICLEIWLAEILVNFVGGVGCGWGGFWLFQH